jgi:hypothetical protein
MFHRDASTMFKAKLLITLAVIGAIHQYYGDDAEDLAKATVPAVSCAAAPAPMQAAINAPTVPAINCAETEPRVTASNG